MILARRSVAEALGTLVLLAVVVGSGIMAERLAGGNVAVALLANAIATGAGLFVLITLLAPVSGAHFNPVVTLSACWGRSLNAVEALVYVGSQLVGGVCGVGLAHLMFGLPLLQTSSHGRSSPGEILAEVVATAGLLFVIQGSRKLPIALIAGLIACYITAAYWFTSSTSFANPAVTIARALTDTFAGIAPASVAAFIGAQLLGGGLGLITGAYVFHSVPAR